MQQQQLLLLSTGQDLWVCLALCICGEVNDYGEKHAVALACKVLYFRCIKTINYSC